MAVILPGKMLFLAHPRTGSIATRNALVKYGGEEIRPHHATFDYSRVVERYNNEPVVCVVRNPYDAVATWWVKSGRKQKGFTGLADYIARNDCKHFVMGDKLFYHLPHATHVLRYEDGVEKQLGHMLPGLEVPPDNVTPDKASWPTYYGPEELQAMSDRFGDEIQALGYPVHTMDSLPKD